MRGLIRELIVSAGEKAAGDIQRGSAGGALVGALIGAALGVGTAFVLESKDLASNLPAACIALGIAGALMGALFGSLYRPSRKLAPWEAVVNDSTVVRVSNLNNALGTIAFCGILVAIGLLLLILGKGNMAVAKWAVAPALIILALILAGFPVLWIDLGPDIRVRRLYRARVLRYADIFTWGFRVGFGHFVHEPPASQSTFAISVKGERSYEIPVAPTFATRVAAVINHHVPTDAIP
jgi:hypothetical protein